MQEEVSIKRLMFLFFKFWWIIVSFIVLFFTLSIIITKFQAKPYNISLSVVPLESKDSKASNNSAGLLSLAGLDGNVSDTPFNHYKFILTSEVLSKRLEERHNVMKDIFPDLWDAQKGSWLPRKTLGYKLVGPIYDFLGIPGESLPTSNLLADFLEQNLEVSTDKDTGVTTISMLISDPALGKRLLHLVDVEADEFLREQAAERAHQSQAYLEQRLATVGLQDSKSALLRLMLEREHEVLMTQPGTQYARNVLQPPYASDLPVKPKPLLNLLVGAMAGLIVGMLSLTVADALTGGRLQRNSYLKPADSLKESPSDGIPL